MGLRPPTNPLLRGAPSPLVRPTRSAPCFRLPNITARFIAILFLMCNNSMYITGMLIYDSNEFYIARSFFVFSLLINCTALYGIWKRSAVPIIPCLVVYSVTLFLNLFACLIVLIFTVGINYERVTKFIYDKTTIDYDFSRSMARLIGYCTMCNAIISIAYLLVLVAALNSIRKEYGREKQILKQVLPSAPPAYESV